MLFIWVMYHIIPLLVAFGVGWFSFSLLGYIFIMFGLGFFTNDRNTYILCLIVNTIFFIIGLSAEDVKHRNKL